MPVRPTEQPDLDKRKEQGDVQPKAQSRDQPRAQSRDEPRDQPRDQSRGQPGDQLRAKSRDQPRDQLRAQSEDQLKDQSKEQPRDQPSFQLRAKSKDQPRDQSKEQPRDQPSFQLRAKSRDQTRTQPIAQPSAKQQANSFSVLTASSTKNGKAERNDFLQFQPIFKSLKDLSVARPGTLRAPLKTATGDGQPPADRLKRKRRKSKTRQIARAMGSKQKLLQKTASPAHPVVSCSNAECKQKFQHRSQMVNHVNYECWYTKLNCLKCENGFRRMHFIAHQRVCRIASMEDLSTTSELNSERTADAPDVCSKDELRTRRNLSTKLLDLALNQMLPKRKSVSDLPVDDSTSETFSLRKRTETMKRGKGMARAKLKTKAKRKTKSQNVHQSSSQSTFSRESEPDMEQSSRLRAKRPSDSFESKSTISNYRINSESAVPDEVEPKLVKKDTPKLSVTKKGTTKFTKGCHVS